MREDYEYSEKFFNFFFLRVGNPHHAVYFLSNYYSFSEENIIGLGQTNIDNWYFLSHVIRVTGLKFDQNCISMDFFLACEINFFNLIVFWFSLNCKEPHKQLIQSTHSTIRPIPLFTCKVYVINISERQNQNRTYDKIKYTHFLGFFIWQSLGGNSGVAGNTNI